MSEPTYPAVTEDWSALADRKAAELLEQVDLVTVTAGDYEKLVQLVGAAYLLGRRDEVKHALDLHRGDSPHAPSRCSASVPRPTPSQRVPLSLTKAVSSLYLRIVQRERSGF